MAGCACAFPETCPGQLKIVCQGRRVDREEISRIVLAALPMDEETELKLSELTLTDTRPGDFSLPDVKLVDELGQNKRKEWGSKLHSIGEMKEMLERQAGEADMGYPYEDWTEYGGWKKKKLAEGTGFLRAVRKMGVGGWWILWGMLSSAWGRIVWWRAVTAVWTAWRNGWTGCRTGRILCMAECMSFMKSGRLSGRREGNVRCFLLNRQIFTGLSERNGMRSGSACFPDS